MKFRPFKIKVGEKYKAYYCYIPFYRGIYMVEAKHIKRNGIGQVRVDCAILDKFMFMNTKVSKLTPSGLYSFFSKDFIEKL